MQQPRELFGGLGNRLFQMAYIYGQFREQKIPDIYVQDYRLWESWGEEIKSWYSKDIVKSDFVSLHIRRGDYVDNPYYVDLSKTEYYDKAIALFPDEKFLVFCADRQTKNHDLEDQVWCMDWLKTKYKDRVQLFKGWRGDEIEDFNSMAGCKGHVMANSSFSWWASYVGGGKTVAPLEWFADGRTIPLPSNFIQV